MLGIIYLLIAVMLGWKITGRFMNSNKSYEQWNENRIWINIPAAVGTGVLLIGWLTYLCSWGACIWFDSERPLMPGNMISIGISVVVIICLSIYDHNHGRFFLKGNIIRNKKMFIVEIFFFVLLGMFLVWILFYVFHIVDGRLYSGFTVFGDYAPHTAMMRSFSWENNFPTEYPHYGGEDVKYHFMFQFLVGNLEFLGMRLDAAYNVLSVLVLEGFFMSFYVLVQRILKNVAAAFISIFLFMFRSSFSFWIYVWENWKTENLAAALTENTVFIGYTPNENWGLWNFNVYLNQRHLGLGMLVAVIVIWIYLEWLEESVSYTEASFVWIKNRLFTVEAWKNKRPLTALFTGILLGGCSFWNGAAVIGTLLILFGFAIFSDGKLDYAITAVVTILLSILQTNTFINGNAMKVTFYWGFLAEDKSFGGVIEYLLIMSGIFFVAIWIPAIMIKRRERVVLASFLIPTIFAFTISLTPDINVNHKYVMISYAFLTMFWAILLVKMWKRHFVLKCAAVILTIILTITGIYDFVVILLDNDIRHRVSVNMESNLTKWLSDHLDHEDLLLTPQYSMNEVTMSGVLLYSGWPYYAWSAGYNTNFRAERAVEIYTSDDKDYVKRLLDEEEITYILYEDDMTYEQKMCREDIIAEVGVLVFTSDDGRIRVYETR